MIDYLTLLLVNMAAGLAMLSAYLLRGIDDEDQRRWVPGFAIVGAVATVFGIHVTVTWPLPGPYNTAYGETSVLLGVLFLAGAWVTARGVRPLGVAVYAAFASPVSLLVGAEVLGLGLTNKPWLSGLGFLLTGLGGLLAAGVMGWFPSNRGLRTAASAILAVASLVWALTGYLAYWGHIAKPPGA